MNGIIIMRNTYYYVQRLLYESEPRLGLLKRDPPQHVSAVVAHDFMGSSEFEWGSVPKTWSYLTTGERSSRSVSELKLGVIPKEDFGGKRDLFLLCDPVDMDAARMALEYLCVKDAPSCKERTGISSALFDDKDPEHRMWLGVDNFVGSTPTPTRPPVLFGTSKQEIMVVLLAILARRRFLLKDVLLEQEEIRVLDQVFWPHKGKLTIFKVAADLDNADGLPMLHLKHYTTKRFVHKDYPLRVTNVNEDLLLSIVGAGNIETFFS